MEEERFAARCLAVTCELIVRVSSMGWLPPLMMRVLTAI